MRKLAQFADRWWWAIIAFWLFATAAAYFTAPSFEEVATYDESAFLPTSAPAIQGGILHEEAWPGGSFSRSAVVAFIREDEELTDRDREYIRQIANWAASERAPEAFGEVRSPLSDEQLREALTSEDGQAVLVVVGLTVPPFTPVANEAVRELRAHIDAETSPPEGLDVYVTGTGAVAADNQAAIDEAVRRVHLITLVLVVAILLFVYRSPVAPLVPLATIGVAFLMSISVVSLLAKAGMDVSSIFESFAIVIVFGAGTDYCLLLVSRFHDELLSAEDIGYEVDGAMRRRTLVATVTVLGAVIASSAAAVIVGFSAQAVAQFGLYRTIGPAMAIAVAITLLAGLTLTPALMRMFGGVLFWPHRAPRHARGDRLLIEKLDLAPEGGPRPAEDREEVRA